LCHWVPYHEQKNAEAVKSTGWFSGTLDVNDTLLIGANVGLEPNMNCSTTAMDLELRLRNSNSLKGLRTSESSFYVDSHSSAISLGGWGLNISGSRTFKRRDGQTLKAALLERWEHERDGNRMIKDLAKGYGLEMSFCSLKPGAQAYSTSFAQRK